MGWRTSDGNTSQNCSCLKQLYSKSVKILSYVNRGPFKAPYWRIYTVPALYNADYQQQTTLTYCENNININTKLWKVQKL